jgi:exopolysaccharide biosynthesis polyprenyl glycosylphosphotransferase
MRNNPRTFFLWLIAVPNLLLCYASLWLTVRVRYPGGLDPESFRRHLVAFSVIYVIWILILFVHNLFEVETFRRYVTLLFSLVSAFAVNALAAIIYFYFQPNLILTPRRFLLLDLAFAFTLVLMWDLCVKWVIKTTFVRPVYLFSFTDELRNLEQEIIHHNYLGFKVRGHVSEATLEDLDSVVPGAIVLLPDDLHAKPEVFRALYSLRSQSVTFYNHRQFYEQLLRRVYIAELSELWFLQNISYTRKRVYNFVKRLLDVCFGFVMSCIFVLTYPLFAVLIKLSSPGPVLFIQERTGQFGKPFRVYKYRTMSGGASNTWTAVNDPRVTRLGRFLRKSKLDELPQFVNVLRGTMSVVGPRPEQPHLVDALRGQIPFYEERHLVKPGITGWAQLHVYAGSVEETKLKLQYDLYYIKHRSFLFDLEILLKTVYFIFTWSGR